MQFDAAGIFVSGTILLGLVGGLGRLAAHHRVNAQRRYAGGIAKSERRRNFLSFMDEWRTEIESENISMNGTEFDEKWADFRRQAAKIRLDYGAEFWRLSNSLSSLCSDEIDEGTDPESPPRRDKLLRRLDAVIDFVKAS